MKKHNGMCPQDIVVLLKIISIRDDKWRNIDIANAISISPSEVSEALNRCKFAKLINSKKKSKYQFIHRIFDLRIKICFPH